MDTKGHESDGSHSKPEWCSQVLRKFAPLLGIAIVALVIGFGAGWIQSSNRSVQSLERVVAMSWEDGRYGPSFYGAHVYLDPQSNGYSVWARVYIGRGNDYFHDCGQLGTVQTDVEAVARWGQIDWRGDGLHIGKGTNHYFLARSKLESHR